jgi:hypothetical protein
MDLRTVKPGMRLQLDSGATVEVLEPPGPDGRTVRVRYLDSYFGPEQAGEVRVVSADEVFGVYTGAGQGSIR